MTIIHPAEAIEIAVNTLRECPSGEQVDLAVALIRAADQETIQALEEQLEAAWSLTT